MPKPSEGRFSANESYDKNTPLQDTKADDKNVEHSSSSITGAVKKPNDGSSFTKELEIKKEKDEKELGTINGNDNSSDDSHSSLEHEDEEATADMDLNTRSKKNKKNSHSKKNVMFKMHFFLSNLREMFIRRKLRSNSDIFENLNIYSRNKILNEANYQELSFFTNALYKLSKMARYAREETRDALRKFKQYFDHDYKDPRDFVKHATSSLSEKRNFGIGGGINIDISTKELIEDVSSINIVHKVRKKAIKEFKEEIEETALAEKETEIEKIKEETKNKRFEAINSKIKMKLAYKSKSILVRKDVIRYSGGSSIKFANAKRTLPSLKRFVRKEGKFDIKSTWSSLAKRISHSAKAYSYRTRSERIKNLRTKAFNKKAFRIPPSMRAKITSR